VATTRTAKFVIEQGARFLAAHRIQLTVLASNKVANNWASVLQFKYEGLMKQFGHDKQDYVMYAKIY
jgi:RimJ/RimL family protein N-acetyltransferase